MGLGSVAGWPAIAWERQTCAGRSSQAGAPSQAAWRFCRVGAAGPARHASASVGSVSARAVARSSRVAASEDIDAQCERSLLARTHGTHAGEFAIDLLAAIIADRQHHR